MFTAIPSSSSQHESSPPLRVFVSAREINRGEHNVRGDDAALGVAQQPGDAASRISTRPDFTAIGI
jgi:hypothetical protein